MFFGLFICQFVCVYDNSKSKEQIFFLKDMDHIFDKKNQRPHFQYISNYSVLWLILL